MSLSLAYDKTNYGKWSQPGDLWNLWDACPVAQGYSVSLKPVCLGLGDEWSLWPHLQKTDVLTTQMMSLAFPEPLQPLAPDRWSSYLIMGYLPPLAKKRGGGRALRSPAKER